MPSWPSESYDVVLEVNGTTHHLSVESRKTLADAIRADCGLTGTHLGCEHGVCGACTVLVDGQPVRSCLVFAVQCDGASVRTVEGLADPVSGELHPVQHAFSEHHALQCGFCTPGFLMLAAHLYDETAGGAAPTEEQVRDVVASNICRCTGYAPIAAATCAVLAERADRQGRARS